MTAALSFGVAAALDHGVIRGLAPLVEQAGLHALWVNDTPGADALAALAVAAEETTTLVLGVGVLPLDRRPPGEIADEVERFGLPAERLVLGVGSGRSRAGALALVADGVAELRARTAASVVVAALGPRMRELAVRDSDGALLSWLTPEAAAEVAAGFPRGARSILYARAIAESGARSRLRREADRYAALPQYAAHFARFGVAPIDTTLDLDAEPGRLAAFGSSVDELVLRAITPADRLDEYARVLERATRPR